MKILYLSTLCSGKEYERMLQKNGSVLSHASQKFHYLFLQGLIENGVEVETLSQRVIINAKNDERKLPNEVEDRIKYTYLPWNPSRKINRIMTIWNSFCGILSWHRKNPEGVIICDVIAGELSLGVWMASVISKIKAIAIVTDVPTIRAGEERKGLKKIPVLIKNAAISCYDGYVFLTEPMNSLLNPKKKPYVIIEGIVDKKVLDVPNALEGKYPEKVCMMAGLLEDVFGVSELLDAFAQVKNPNARLVFYGKGTSVEKIEEYAKNDSRITYKGELSNKQIVEEEKKVSLLINPRPPVGEWTAYSFPSKNIEYLASGTPMLAYNLPCIPEEYLKYFFQINSTDKKVFADTLNMLLEMERSQLHNFGLKAQEWIVETRSADKQMEKVKQMIKRL